MTGYYTAAQIRAAEEATGDLLSGGVLMVRAANAVAGTVLARLRRRGAGVYGRRVLLVVGAGNNGGDALFAGATLVRRGVRVEALLLDPDRAHRAGLSAFRRVGGRVTDGVPQTLDVAVDAVVGLGGRGPLRPQAAAVFDVIAQTGATVVAVDLPSGIDPDTGVVHQPSVRADVSVTFGAPRLAHLLAGPQCGEVVVADIGIDLPESSVDSPSNTEVAQWWPLPGPHDDKYSQGVVGIVAGSATYPGAAVLSTAAAVAATSGMTRYIGPAAEQVLAVCPEVVTAAGVGAAGRVQAWAIGPGIGTGDQAHELLADVLAADLPTLIDADGLTVLARDPGLLAGRAAPTLLTPHAGEFARLAGADPTPDRLTAVRALAERMNATVLLKGRITLVADPDGRVSGNDAGSSWAATAGAGDVLTGIAGALLSAGLPARAAGVAAARVHGLAAARASGGAPIGASALRAAVAPALRELSDLRE
ncbi:bifunctional ADP-dependent NAD(P)H-hydrate dehydratase/NAD(P)H-hydrate epimerase [Gordonia neofelifaecis]|uniref:Bifunctional NAD(P)H-hydrate repair enzyme n=1 Tax=Gordonia neofelifaecis NRRL B-59395 TaxID=644548 RepID=F1YFJ0_9ACTN|nr:bifunctional ADP-dependent NAD(P)H-hydrate dehydratase/NAD(P)H-hydrate epimerase [Gordonia neofelifaecis]EGD56478.1 carbohydrate kinase, YjeF related protein [Gordonia neofelifaecis NRRL B-59395]